MTKEQVKKRIEKLREVIRYHRYLYHVENRQEISDAALDSLKKELFDLEQRYPEFITPDSPTQRVGGKPLDKFKKTRHPQIMLSFNDAFTQEDIQEWQKRLFNFLAKREIKDIDYFCELKFDGLAIELIYENGILKIGSTRGDGIVGEDVTLNVKTIEAIPLRLFLRNPPKQVVVRGEALISKKEFEAINKERWKRGEPPYANPRNIAAGSIRQLDPRVTAQRNLDFFAYDLITDLGQRTHQQEHQILKELGFKTVEGKLCQNLKEVFEWHRYWQENREKLEFEIDGIVVQVNNNEIFRKAGVAGKAPRAAIAYKFPLRQAETVVKDICVQIGRTGAVTPVAILRPVQVGGVTISRATLHNQDEVKRLGVKIGDTVIVGRAGDVIPEILKVLKEMRTGQERDFYMPKKCPVCRSALVKSSGEAILRCPNKNCAARRQRALEHFVSRGAFNIEGLGKKIIEQLLDHNLISDGADLFDLKKGDLLALEGFQEKSAQNLIASIKRSQKIPLSRFIYALGIQGVGEETAILLGEKISSNNLNIVDLNNQAKDWFQEIEGVGPVVAESIYQWFHSENNQRLLRRLLERVEIQYPKIKKTHPLQGKTFVFTGELQSFTREQAKRKIRELGGKVSSIVSGKTDYLVLGRNPGSKLKKAKELGIKILNEKEFLNLTS